MAAPGCPLTTLTSPRLIHNRPPYPALYVILESLATGWWCSVSEVVVWGFLGCGWCKGVWQDRPWRNDVVQSISAPVAPEEESCANTHKHTCYTHNIQMPSFTSPSCTSWSRVKLVCQEAEGVQIYNDSREQHQVTTVNIYTGLTKDVAKVYGGFPILKKLRLIPDY